MSNYSQNNLDANNQFAKTDQEAARRFERYKSEDPFPEIPPALLNSADVEDYIAKTALLWPFHRDSKLLKPASYEVRLLGKCVYWDEKGGKRVVEIREGTEFDLKPNSIAFVTLEPRFRLPDYIALRFNLKITHVYRGLLLGTGPLVDPGFNGKLSIPLHNLTTNKYTFRGGEGLIWMEFTKLSPNKRWDSSKYYSEVRQGRYIEFRQDKNELKEVEEYLHKADPHRPIRSSIPDAIQDAQRSARNALNQVRILGGVVGGLSLIGFIAVVFQVLSLVQDTNTYLNSSQKELNNLQNEVNLLKQKAQ